MRRILTLLLPPIRWLRAAIEIVGGARVDPTVVLLGKRSQIRLGKMAKIGPGCKLDPGSAGKIDIKAGVWTSSDTMMETQTMVQIGHGTTIQRRCTINGTVRLGRGCILAPSVFISSGTHPFREVAHLTIREQERCLELAEDLDWRDRPIWIQDDCWIGTHAVICPGVTVGKGSIIGANSVVTKDVPPYSVYAGSPASPIGSRLPWQPRSRIDPRNAKDHPYLLDGALISSGGEYALVLSPADPFLAALAVPSTPFKVLVNWNAQDSFVWNINGKRIPQEAGSGVLGLSYTDLTVRENVAYCSVKVEQTGLREGLVNVLSLSVEGGS